MLTYSRLRKREPLIAMASYHWRGGGGGGGGRFLLCTSPLRGWGLKSEEHTKHLPRGSDCVKKKKKKIWWTFRTHPCYVLIVKRIGPWSQRQFKDWPVLQLQTCRVFIYIYNIYILQIPDSECEPKRKAGVVSGTEPPGPGASPGAGWQGRVRVTGDLRLSGRSLPQEPPDPYKKARDAMLVDFFGNKVRMTKGEGGWSLFPWSLFPQDLFPGFLFLLNLFPLSLPLKSTYAGVLKSLLWLESTQYCFPFRSTISYYIVSIV